MLNILPLLIHRNEQKITRCCLQVNEPATKPQKKSRHLGQYMVFKVLVNSRPKDKCLPGMFNFEINLETPLLPTKN